MVAEPIDCAMVFDQLDLYLDGELPAERHDELRTHLAACLPCAGHHDLNQQLQELVRDRCAAAAPPALVDRIRDHLASPAG